MTEPPIVPAPTHLSAETRRWWTDVVENYELAPHNLNLLRAACEAWDRMQCARQTVAESGLTFMDSHGNLKAHPAVAIEKDARIAFARLVRELKLGDANLGETRLQWQE